MLDPIPVTPRPSADATILHTVGGLQMGGVGRLLLHNVGELEGGGFTNRVCYLRPRHDMAPEFRQAGIHPTRIPYDGARSIPAATLRLTRLVRQSGANLVHTNHLLDHVLGGTAARLAGVPVIRTLHYVVAPPGERDAGPRAGLERSLSAAANRWLADHFIAVSEAVAEAHTGFSNVPPERVTVVHPGLHVQRWVREPRPEELRRIRVELGLEGAYPVLVNVGRLRPVKRQDRLVALMGQLVRERPFARLLIVGEGICRRRLERSIRDRGLESHVHLLGQRSDVREILGVSDIFVSTSDREGFGLALVEAMLAGLPVICTLTRAFTEILDSGVTGYIIPDEASLPGRVLALAAEPDLLRRMGARAREVAAERFDVARSVRRLEAVYDRVLGPSREVAEEVESR